ncbi:MAG TPA: hypothetical protein PL041_09760 [Melioribacteraceae bacterium]|nr:hypothetical protein [Melioribacteraceae bacterium]
MKFQIILLLFFIINSINAQMFYSPIINENNKIIDELKKIMDEDDELNLNRVNYLLNELKKDKYKINDYKSVQDNLINLEKKYILLNQEENNNRVYSAYRIYYNEFEIGQLINVSGEVNYITKNKNNTYSVFLNNNLQAIFPASLKREVLNLYKSQEVIIKGSIAKDEFGNIILIRCSLFNPNNYDAQIVNLNNEVNNLINSYTNILEAEIKQKLLSEAESCYSNKNYEKALLLYDDIKNLNILSKNIIENRIDSINKYINKNEAINNLDKNGAKSLDDLFELSFPEDFDDTRSSFFDIYEKYIADKVLLATKKKDLKIYNDVFELAGLFIQKSTHNFIGYFKSKKEELIINYKNFLGEYLKVANNTYSVIPGGKYYSERKKEFVIVTDFLINPILFNKELLKAYNNIYNKNIGYSTLFYDTKDRQEIEDELNIKFISEIQYEYLEYDFWESKIEKSNFKCTKDIDNIIPNELMLVKDLSEIRELEIYPALVKNAESKKENYSNQIKEIKKRAYETGVVKKWYSFMIVPLVTADGGGFIHKNSQLNNIITDEKVYFQAYPGNISIGWALFLPIKNYSERFFTDNQVGGIQLKVTMPAYNYLIDKSRIHNIGNSDIKYNVSQFSLKGFDVELLFRNSGNIVFGLGYSSYNLEYNFELLHKQDLIYKGYCKEKIKLITGTFGFYINQTTFWTKIAIPYNNTETFNSKNGINLFWSAGINFGLPVKLFANDIFGNKW